MAYTTIPKSSDYFNTKIYSGSGSSPNALTGVGFQPDLTWFKKRNAVASHFLYDAIRGVSKYLLSDDPGAEATNGYLSSFDTDGFTLGSTSANINASGGTYVAWNWLGSNTTAANTVGDIASTVSANTTSGFSVVSYTGNGVDLSTTPQTVGHGLSGVSMVIIKNLSQSIYWIVKQKDLSSNKVLYLNDTSAESTPTGGNQGHIGNLSSSGTTFELVSNSSNVDNVNVNGNNYIAYCFAEKQGYSKFGSYVGNGNADGTFIYTGFKPAFVITKAHDTAGLSWSMHDNKRLGYNGGDRNLYANISNGENTDNAIDILSNGFKMRSADGSTNQNGVGYIYMAFASEPLVGDNPATAR